MENWVESIILYAPGYCSVFWLAMLILFGEKKSPQTALLILAVIFSIKMFLGVEYLNTGVLYTRKVVYLEILSNWTTLLIFPTTCIYIKALRGKEINLILTILSAIPSIIIGISTIVIFKISGVENASVFLSDLYSGKTPTLSGSVYDIAYFVLFQLYYTFFYTGLVASLLYSFITLFKNGYKPGELFRVIFRNGSISNINNSCILLSLIMLCTFASTIPTRAFILEHGVFTTVSIIVTTVLHFLLYYTGTFFYGHKITLKRLRHPGVTKTDNDIYLDLDIADRRKSAVLKNEQQDDMTREIIRYIETEGHFADKDITIESITKAIGTNRTYVSMIMKSNLHTSFRSYINGLRINEAKRLLLEKPNELLEAVAAGCGFASDSQFVKKFKESTGMTPREWQVHNLQR